MQSEGRVGLNARDFWRYHVSLERHVSMSDNCSKDVAS